MERKKVQIEWLDQNGQSHIFECNSKKSHTNIQIILAEDADDNAKRTEHCGGCQDFYVAKSVFLLF